MIPGPVAKNQRGVPRFGWLLASIVLVNDAAVLLMMIAFLTMVFRDDTRLCANRLALGLPSAVCLATSAMAAYLLDRSPSTWAPRAAGAAVMALGALAVWLGRASYCDQPVRLAFTVLAFAQFVVARLARGGRQPARL